MIAKISMFILTGTIVYLLGGLQFLFADNGSSNGSKNKDKEVALVEKSIPNELRYPTNLLRLDGRFSHHVLVVEKSTHRLHLFQNNNGVPEYVLSYQIATGQTAGDKSNSGDLKTPEGIYQLVSFLSEKELLRQYGPDGKKYGSGAFVSNYPNLIDYRNGKTGSGIWLHSTNDESRLLKGLDSKGCVVVANQHLKDISRYIELNFSPMIIVQDLFFVRKETWESNRDALVEALDGWVKAWREEDLNKYISFYHQEFRDSTKGNYKNFRQYKAAVFQNPGKPIIEISNSSILVFGDYAVIEFRQYYKSNTIDDIGRKILYLKKDNNYRWRIYAELWGKLDDRGGNFVPSMRFFNN